MNDYILLFRMDITTPAAQPDPSQMQEYMKQWTNWIAEISAAGRLADGGNHFSRYGVVLKGGNTVIDGPYTQNNESVAGYIIILAHDFEDAQSYAKKCPILKGQNTSVEIRKAENV